ncbi:hypothetical protein [Streptosporangium vulgare]|uniref:Uncharacterized protein n=1 Tax=Streptosporangium vulgare TaxID=46190 RepID=A0ABV5T6E2_9ACTN
MQKAVAVSGSGAMGSAQQNVPGSYELLPGMADSLPPHAALAR